MIPKPPKDALKTIKNKSKTEILVFALFFAIAGSFLIYISMASQHDPNSVEKFVNKPAKGLVWDGLSKPGAGSPCVNSHKDKSNQDDDLLEVKDNNGKSQGCSHGPDPLPDGLDMKKSTPTVDGVTANEGVNGYMPSSSTPIQCIGDGQSGNRVQLIYAHASDVPSRYSQYTSSFQAWARNINAIYSESAKQTGSDRDVRFVTNSNCDASVSNVTLSRTGDDTFGNTIDELKKQGFNRQDRKYLVWADASTICGIGGLYLDDNQATNNVNNAGPQYARVDNPCWNSAEAHELTHMLGGIQRSAPHSTASYHCYDGHDEMCYSDWSATTNNSICALSQQHRLDCNKDDYFYAGNPLASNYLYSHWNVANSSFLLRPSQWYPYESIESSSLGKIGQTVASAPSITTWGSGRLDVFVKSGKNTLLHKWNSNGTWSSWEDLGGSIASAPAAVSMASGRIDVYAKSTNNTLLHKWFAGGKWTGGWEDLGGYIDSAPTVASMTNGRMDVFARGKSASSLKHIWFVNGGWTGWEDLGGTFTVSPTVVSMTNGRLDVFVRGVDGALKHKWIAFGTWTGWEDLGGSLSSSPGAVSMTNGRIDVYARGLDAALKHKWVTPSGWTGWEDLGGYINDAPSATSWEDKRMDLVMLGADAKSLVYRKFAQ